MKEKAGIMIHLERDIYDFIATQANKEKRSKSNMINVILEDYINTKKEKSNN